MKQIKLTDGEWNYLRHILNEKGLALNKAKNKKGYSHCLYEDELLGLNNGCLFALYQAKGDEEAITL